MQFHLLLVHALCISLTPSFSGRSTGSLVANSSNASLTLFTDSCYREREREGGREGEGERGRSKILKQKTKH